MSVINPRSIKYNYQKIVLSCILFVFKFNRSNSLSFHASLLCIDEYLKSIALRGDIAISNEIYRNGFRTRLWTQLNRKRIKYTCYHYT